MKNMKWLLAAMALFAMVAMIGCPVDEDPPPPPAPPSVSKVDVDGGANATYGYKGQYTAVVTGTNLSNAQKTVTWTATTEPDSDGDVFPIAGVSISATGELDVGATVPVNTKILITATSTFKKDKSGSLLVTVIAPVTIEFWSDTTANSGISVGTVTLPRNTTFTAQGKTAPDTSSLSKTNYKYSHWAIYDSALNEGAGGWVRFSADSTTFPEDTDVVAQWLSVEFTDNDSKAQAKVVLENGAHVIAQFDMTGKNWADYDKITVEYKIAESEQLKTIRAVRLYGVYKWSDTVTQAESLDWNGDFTKSKNNTGSVDAEGKPVTVDTYVAKFDSKNAAYIMNDKGGAWGTDWTKTLGVAADKIGNQWFTVEYPIDGTGKNSGFNNDNLPGGANNTGETDVFFGIGLSGTNSNANANDWANNAVVQLIGDVKLKAKTGGTDVSGTLNFRNTGKLAFASQIDPIIFSGGSLNSTDTISFIPFVPPPYTGPVADADFSVTIPAGGLISLADPTGENYQAVIYVPIEFPLTGDTEDPTERFTIASYANYTVVVKFFASAAEAAADTSTTGDTDKWGYGNLVFAAKKGEDPTSLTNFNTLATQYNLGAQTANRPIPPAALVGWENFAGFVMTNGEHNDESPVIKVLSITFHAAQ